MEDSRHPALTRATGASRALSPGYGLAPAAVRRWPLVATARTRNSMKLQSAKTLLCDSHGSHPHACLSPLCGAYRRSLSLNDRHRIQDFPPRWHYGSVWTGLDARILNYGLLLLDRLDCDALNDFDRNPPVRGCKPGLTVSGLWLE